MIVGSVTLLAVGLLCVVIGANIGIKKNISLIHDYHRRNVKESDLPAYCLLIGIGLIIIGVGTCLSGVLILTYLPLWWIPLPVGAAIGLYFIFKAQKKYNGSVFS